MSGEADFLWDLLSDVWDEYADRDRQASAWEGYLQIASDLVLQILQTDLSKSILDIPVFRRYRWRHYPLVKTVTPSSYQSPNLFAYDAGDVDILNIPNLQDLTRAPNDDEFSPVGNSSTGSTTNGSQLQDLLNPFSASVRVGDFVRLLEGADLEDADANVRMQIVRLDGPSLLTLNVAELSTSSGVSYIIERSPSVEIIEGLHYTVNRGKLNFCPAPVLTQDGLNVAFRAVETLEYAGDFVRDDPRLIAAGGNAVTSGTGNITVTSPTLTDSSALFLTNPTVPERPVAGDYLVLRPSGVQPSQILTTQQVFKIAGILSDTQLEFDGVAPTTTDSVTYDILKPSAEDFDLVSSEDGLDEFPLGYAFRTVAAAAPSGTAGEVFAVDQLRDVTKDFTGLVGKKIRVLSGTGLDTSELAEFTITEILNSPAFDTVQLERAVTSLSSAPDAVYLVGDVVAVDVIDTRPATGLVLPDAFQFKSEDSNTSSVTDGSIFFSKELVPSAGPLIKSLRDHIANSNSQEAIKNQLWAEETIVDQEALFENYGFPIQVQQDNSVEYKNVLQGLWYAYWNGPSLDNLVRGLNLVFDLPFAPKDGVISDISLPDPAQLVGTVASLTNPTPNTFDTSAANPFGDSRFLSFATDNQPPTLVIFADDPINPNTTARDAINLAVGSPIASLNPIGQMVLSALTSVKIDTVIGNPGLGFEPGSEDFGTFNVTINFDDGTSETLVFGTQFPLAVSVGDRVERFQQLTTAVGVFDYVGLPEWWRVFGIAQINASIESFSPADRDIINDILKDFTFAVRVVADAFTRLGTVDRDIIKFFLEQIKPTISDFLFIVAVQFFDIISVTDDRNLLGAVPAPSPEFIAQHSGEAPYVQLDIGLKMARNINWNFANYNQLTPAERAAFETTYHLPQFDDLRLGTEEITVVAPVKIIVIDGIGAVSYLPAVVDGTVSSFFMDTSTQLVMRRHGVVPLIVPVFPTSPMSVDAVISHINTWYQTLFFQEVLVGKNPDGTLHFTIDRFGAASQVEVLIANPGLGLVLSSNLGAGSTLGVLDVIHAS